MTTSLASTKFAWDVVLSTEDSSETISFSIVGVSGYPTTDRETLILWSMILI